MPQEPPQLIPIGHEDVSSGWLRWLDGSKGIPGSTAIIHKLLKGFTHELVRTGTCFNSDTASREFALPIPHMLGADRINPDASEIRCYMNASPRFIRLIGTSAPSVDPVSNPPGEEIRKQEIICEIRIIFCEQPSQLFNCSALRIRNDTFFGELRAVVDWCYWGQRACAQSLRRQQISRRAVCTG